MVEFFAVLILTAIGLVVIVGTAFTLCGPICGAIGIVAYMLCAYGAGWLLAAKNPRNTN